MEGRTEPIPIVLTFCPGELREAEIAFGTHAALVILSFSLGGREKLE